MPETDGAPSTSQFVMLGRPSTDAGKGNLEGHVCSRRTGELHTP
jgi:hypothetical protein